MIPNSRILYIGRARNVAGLSGYGFGDAQIDAQNRTTAAIGDIKAAYNAVKEQGKLTPAYIDSAGNQMLSAIQLYNSQFGSTSRGAAGYRTLQTFYDTKIAPELSNDRSSIAVVGGVTTSPLTADYSDQPIQFGPQYPGSAPDRSINVTIAPQGNPDSNAGNLQPQQSPGAPSGITIPGTTVDVHDTVKWYENPVYLLVAGVALSFLLSSHKDH